MGPMEQYT